MPLASFLEYPLSLSRRLTRQLTRSLPCTPRAGKNAKTEKRWRATLDAYASPVLGDMLVSEIDSSHIKAVLLQKVKKGDREVNLWLEMVETSKKVRERIGLVMKWSIAERFRPDNPAGPEIIKALPKQPQQQGHYPALPYQEVGSALAKVRNTSAWWATKACLEFTTLTAVRSGEARLAMWNEFDQSTGVWTIPASRMKRNLEHKVPLCYATMDLLVAARTVAYPNWPREEAGLVFPSPSGKALTDSTVSSCCATTTSDVCLTGCVPVSSTGLPNARTCQKRLPNTPSITSTARRRSARTDALTTSRSGGG